MVGLVGRLPIYIVDAKSFHEERTEFANRVKEVKGKFGIAREAFDERTR